MIQRNDKRPTTLWTRYILSNPKNSFSKSFNLVASIKFIDRVDIAKKALNFATAIQGFWIDVGWYHSQITSGNTMKSKVRRKPGLMSCWRFNRSKNSSGKYPAYHLFFKIFLFWVALFFLIIIRDIELNTSYNVYELLFQSVVSVFTIWMRDIQINIRKNSIDLMDWEQPNSRDSTGSFWHELELKISCFFSLKVFFFS